MGMKTFDPAVAARVWQRVQAATKEQYTEKPACPLEGICTVPAVQKKALDGNKVCRQVHRGCTPDWWLPVLVYVLAQLFG